jgi:taurine dioxygenase
MQIRPLTPTIGAEIFGADLRDAAQFPQIRQAFIDHSVIVIRDQTITPDDHLAFARRWGDINVNRFFKALPSHPEIALVLKEADQHEAVGESWHTDHSYDQMPAMGSILHAIEVPDVGGDTLFVSMGAAYDALSEPFRARLSGLVDLHESAHVFGSSTVGDEAHKSGRFTNADRADQVARHPVVVRHPLSGRAGLYVNPNFTTGIEGMAKGEADAILAAIYTHCKEPEFHCRIRWRKGDVTMWDNRATWHKAINDYHGHRRLMHRVTVEGCALDAA